MARFSQIAKGTRARHPVNLSMPDGQLVKVMVRAFHDDDDDRVDQGALNFAKKRGVADPKPGNPIYNRGAALHVLLLSCSDPESPDDAPVPFFTSIEEISDGLDGERIEYLKTAHDVWQDQCSPRKLKMSFDEMIGWCMEAVPSEDEDPFLRLRPALAWSLLRTFAALFMSLPELKSLYTSVCGNNSTVSENVPTKDDRQ